MKSRLLRKLRKEAHALIGVKLCGNGVYYVGRRSSLSQGIGCFSLEAAKKVLSEARREEIISMVMRLRQQERVKNIEQKNKELSKL